MPIIQIAATMSIATEAISFCDFKPGTHTHTPKKRDWGLKIPDHERAETYSTSALDIFLTTSGPLPTFSGDEADRIHALIAPHIQVSPGK